MNGSERKFIFGCPVCGKPLAEINRTLRCPDSHSFDIAASGYVNLLRTQSARTHGDDRDMVRARRGFLSRGYYAPVAAAAAEACADALSGGESSGLAGRFITLADLGCGEGFYTSFIADSLRGKGARVVAAGFDISRDAADMAAKAHPSESFAVAGIYALPVSDRYADIALSMFAPFPEDELIRTVKTGGFIVRALPLERHLWELKRLLYDEPRENDPPEIAGRIPLIRRESVGYKITVSGDDLRNLFAMTPYARRTARSDAARLEQAEKLEVTVSVGIFIYSNNNNY